MMSLWWLALPVLLLPIWWHRQKRERAASRPLATARFLPRTNPLHQRVWRWHDRTLLVLRCLLLVGVIAWLADLTIPWRGDAVLVAPGTNTAWAEKQIGEAGFAQATRMALPSADAFAWLARHEHEWRPGARLMVVGPVSMPASRPRLAHQVVVRAAPLRVARSEYKVAVVSKRAAKWRAVFAAIDGPQRFVVQDVPDAKSDLIVWDVPQAPPAQLRAPLWWIGDRSAFPELNGAPAVDGIGYAASARGRLWFSPAWPADDPDTARAQFDALHSLHLAPLAWPVASQDLAPAAPDGGARPGGALRYLMTIALLALFALERILSHATRR